jgi:hypothetical protein
MRLTAALLVLTASAAASTACQSEAGQRQALIDSGVQACVRGYNEKASTRGGALQGIDSQRVCSCVMEKIAEGKSTEELRTASRQDEPSPEDMRHMGACFTQEAQRAGIFTK